MNELHLFAGAGGGILGGMLCGHTTVCAVEIEPYCRKVLLQRQRDGILPKFPIWDDVCTFDGTPWRGKVDVVCGGFPCTDISQIKQGAEGIKGESSGLWSEMARITNEVRPRYVFIENSPQLVHRGLGQILCDLSRMGYDARWGILGACHANAPHIRNRIWILGYPKRQRLEGYNRHEQTKEGRTDENRPNFPTSIYVRGWKRVVYASDCSRDMDDVDGFHECPECGYEYGECECPGPTMDNLTYQVRNNGEYAKPSDWWASESCVQRVAHGVGNRVDRLKAIGNGQVPAVAAMAWKILSK